VLDRARWYGLWYVSIAFGFALLALRQALIGGSVAGIIVRLLIAAAFAALGWRHLRPR
jgi:hypothetical protein